MKEWFKKLSDKPVKTLIVAKLFADLICVLIGYKLFPYLLNYPPNSINTPFQLSVNPYYYNVYYFSIFIIGIIVDLIIANKILKPLKNFKKAKNINKVREVCYRYPSSSLIITSVIIPLIIVIGMLLVTNTNRILTIKIAMLAVIFLGVPNLVLYFFSTKILKEVLIETFDNEIYKHEKVKKTYLYGKVLTEVFSTVVISFILVFMFAVANVTNEIAEYRFETYNQKLNSVANEIKNSNIKIKDLESFLNHELSNENWFYKINGECKGKTKISKFMSNYIDYYSKANGGRTYDYYGENLQGAVKYITINNQEIVIGITYTISNNIFTSLLGIIIGFLIVDAIVIYLSSRTIGSNLNDINENLEKILKSKKVELNLLPITSTDEIGRLSKEINKVQEKTNTYIEKIEQDQFTMQRQAQFAILGEFAGGLAHDLNSPLSAVKLDVATIGKYIKSNKISTDERTKQKLEEMLDNVESSLNNMGNIILGVRNQIRATGDTDNTEFSLLDVLEGIKLMFRSIFMKHNCQLEINVPPEIKIYGEKNKLDRVLSNLIRNSIDAYAGKQIKGIVKVDVEQNNEKTIIIVSDEAGGIDNSIKDKIFKELKTTKGDKGTGFGLYYSNTIIEGSFNGKMCFETKEGLGTKFFIEIPNREEK